MIHKAETMPTSAARQSLASLPIDAQFTISSILGSNKEDYHVIPTEEVFRSAHPTQALETDFTSTGILVRVGNVSWRLALLGYGEALEPVAPVQPQAKDNRVEYPHGETRCCNRWAITIWL
ncbi:hypothetical protein ACFLZW_06495 [Chloroflexota bacterium]